MAFRNRMENNHPFYVISALHLSLYRKTMTTKEFKNKILPLSQRIFPMAMRMLGNSDEAQDAVQEIMIKLWSGRKKVGSHPNVSGLVFLMTKNYCLDRLKARKRAQRLDTEQKYMAYLYVEGEQNNAEDLIALVRKIIVELPENQQEVILLRDIDGLEFEEIVEITQLKIEHIRVLLSRARKHVRQQLENKYNYEEGIY